MVHSSLRCLFFFLVFFLPSAYAEEEWTIDKFKDLVLCKSESGEITHGDSLNFFISTADDCDKSDNNFTFYTYEKPKDINQLLR